MEFPFGHHRRDDADEEEPERFPPPGNNFPSDFDDTRPPRTDFDPYDTPPPPQYEDNQYIDNTHGGGGGYVREEPEYRPEAEYESYGDGGGRGDRRDEPEYRPEVEYESYGDGGGRGDGRDEPEYRPEVAYESYGDGGSGGYGREEPSYDGGFTDRQPTVRVFTKAREDFSLTIRDGEVVLAPADPSDEYQHWIKDTRYSTKVQDEEGLPSFALVNKVTGEAIKHAMEQSHPVRLVPYNPDYLDESVLWTESHDTGEDFRCIRMVNNITLNFDAFHGDEDHGGVRDGTSVVLWEWTKGDNQRWKVVPY